MITSILTILLYALVTCLCLELVFYIIALFIAVPPRIRQLIYAIVGVIFIIWLVQVVLGGASVSFPPLRDRR